MRGRSYGLRWKILETAPCHTEGLDANLILKIAIEIAPEIGYTDAE